MADTHANQGLPLVSIITPAYNASDYIAETVESVLAQDYPNLEYIIINDGSSDDTLERLEPFSKRARILSHQNRGEQATVNRGVEEAQGEIVAVVNADDPLRPGMVRAAVEALLARPELSGVYPDWLKIDSQGRVIEEIKTVDYDLMIMLQQHYCIPGPGGFFRKSRLGGEPARDPRFRYSGDFHMWLRLALAGPLQRLPKAWATWRFHEAGGSQAGRNLEMATNKVAIIEDIYQRPNLLQEVRAQKRQALSAAYYGAGLLAIYNPVVPGRRYMLKSILLKPIWPRGFIPMQRRSWPHIAYIMAQPLSNALYRAWLKLSGRGQRA